MVELEAMVHRSSGPIQVRFGSKVFLQQSGWCMEPTAVRNVSAGKFSAFKTSMVTLKNEAFLVLES